MMNDDKHHDRRRYFRVNDHVGLRVSLVSEAELGGEEVKEQTPEERLKKVNNAINRQLAALKRRDESLAMLVGMINHKVELLFNEFIGNSSKQAVSDTTHKVREVNLSACGLAFPFPRELSTAQNLRISIKLFPSEEVVEVIAMVVGCDRRDTFAAELSDEEMRVLKEEPYWVRANYEEIEPLAQELLAQYVIQKQANSLASRRVKKN